MLGLTAQTVVSAVETVIMLRGDLDLFTVDRLNRAVSAAVSDGSDRIMLDVSEIAFCDSSGLAAFIGWRKRVAAAGGEFALRNVNRTLGLLLEMTATTYLCERPSPT